MKKCMEYEVEGPRPRRRPGERLSKRTVKHVNWTQSMDRGKWRKLIKDVWWSRWVWVGECFFWYRPTRVVPDQRPLNGCVCVCNLQLSLLHNVKRLGHMLLSQNWCQTLSRIVTHSSCLWDKPGTRSACFQPICCMICCRTAASAWCCTTSVTRRNEKTVFSCQWQCQSTWTTNEGMPE